jgi:hypothetical protein
LALKPILDLYCEELYETSIKLSKNEEIGESSKYEKSKKLFLYCEKIANKIMKKTDPCPQRYKKIDDFDNDLEGFKNEYVELIKELELNEDELKFANELKSQFDYRFEKQYRELIKNFLSVIRPNIFSFKKN